jgi:hypothetical protein
MWRQTTVHPFCGAKCGEAKEWSAAARSNNVAGFPTCPPALEHQLAVNNLQVDEQTVTDGNCGPDGFVISLAHQRACANCRASTAIGAKKMTHLFKLPVAGAGRRSWARQEGVRWLREHRTTMLESGYTTEAFCYAVSGQPWESYDRKMFMDGEWADTALILGMACAFGVDVVIFQVGMDPALLGISLLEGAGPDQASMCPSSRLVPMALVNDRHFWGLRSLQDSELLPGPGISTTSSALHRIGLFKKGA